LTTGLAPRKRWGMTIATFDDVEAEFEALDDWDDRYRLLIDLGRALPAMPDVLKTDATRVRGCASQVWLHPRFDGERLHFAADSDAAIVKGLVALVLMLADNRAPRDIDTAAIRARLDALGLAKHLSSNRTQGLASMVARIGELAHEVAR
jgi:cysteine desulfuration protein SufE